MIDSWIYVHCEVEYRLRGNEEKERRETDLPAIVWYPTLLLRLHLLDESIRLLDSLSPFPSEVSAYLKTNM